MGEVASGTNLLVDVNEGRQQEGQGFAGSGLEQKVEFKHSGKKTYRRVLLLFLIRAFPGLIRFLFLPFSCNTVRIQLRNLTAVYDDRKQ